MSRTSSHDLNENNVIVTFPASKNFKPVEEIKNPLVKLKEEVKESKSFNERIALNLPNEVNNLTEVSHSLEVRLNVLEEIEARLKFYVDDLEAEVLKSHFD
ncbi:MAG: hypothetical protein CME69_08395 [Halobacteriovorax sp.]|nr:hypothetical protein [Halobacteriovorax sp.]|tara:strand:+ start:483 stop:785 length:303 start_codon:yes stop_codon:yes gene_type:complete